MADGEQVRVEIGFEGGQVIGAFVDASSADQLERALHEDGPRVVVLDERGRPVPRDRAAGGLFQALQPGEPRRVRHGLAG